MQGARFDPKPSQVGERRQKRRRRKVKKYCVRSGI